jgi:hypothetical protein
MRIHDRGSSKTEDAMAKSFAMILGIMLLAIGVWGTATGGHNHEIALFGVNTAHNLVHLLSGALAIGTALAGVRAAKVFLILFGLVYGLVAVCGFINVTAAVQMLNLNMADNWLHAAIAVGCLWAGIGTKT